MDHAAHGVADYEVDAGRAAGSDGDEFPILRNRAVHGTETGPDEGGRGQRSGREAGFLHVAYSLRSVRGRCRTPIVAV